MTSIEATLPVPADRRAQRLAPFEELALLNRALTQGARELIEATNVDADDYRDATPWILINRVETPAHTYTTLGQAAMVTGRLDIDSYSQPAAETKVYRALDIDEGDLEGILAIQPEAEALELLKPEFLEGVARTYLTSKGSGAEPKDEILKWAEGHAPQRFIAPLHGIQREIQRAHVGRHLGRFDSYLRSIKKAAENPTRNPQLHT